MWVLGTELKSSGRGRSEQIGATSAAEGDWWRSRTFPASSCSSLTFLRMQLATFFLAFQRLFHSLVHYKRHREPKSISQSNRTKPGHLMSLLDQTSSTSPWQHCSTEQGVVQGLLPALLIPEEHWRAPALPSEHQDYRTHPDLAAQRALYTKAEPDGIKEPTDRKTQSWGVDREEELTTQTPLTGHGQSWASGLPHHRNIQALTLYGIRCHSNN